MKIDMQVEPLVRPPPWIERPLRTRTSCCINLNEVPGWQRRGIGLWWETFDRPGFDPVREVEVTASRRQVKVERELPMKAAYREFVERLCANP